VFYFSPRKYVSLKIKSVGYMDVVEALLPYRNATKMILPIGRVE
jgi:hypothetical protein